MSAGEVEAAADLAATAVDRLDIAGRPLAAANRAVPPEASAWGRLWQACTTLREHRGDGHVARLRGRRRWAASTPTSCRWPPEPCPGRAPAARGWSDEEWDAAAARPRRPGLLDADGALTDAGRRVQGGDRGHDRRAGGSPVRRLGARAGPPHGAVRRHRRRRRRVRHGAVSEPHRPAAPVTGSIGPPRRPVGHRCSSNVRGSSALSLHISSLWSVGRAGRGHPGSGLENEVPFLFGAGARREVDRGHSADEDGSREGSQRAAVRAVADGEPVAPDAAPGAPPRSRPGRHGAGTDARRRAEAGAAHVHALRRPPHRAGGQRPGCPAGGRARLHRRGLPVRPDAAPPGQQGLQGRGHRHGRATATPRACRARPATSATTPS